MHEHRFGVVTGTCAVVLLVAGCGGASGGASSSDASGSASPGQSSATTPVASSTSASSTSAVATPTPTATPAADPHPALNELLISTSGLGPLTVGTVPPASNPGAAMVVWDADFCASDPEPVDEPGRWVPSGYGNDTNYMGEQATPFYVAASDAGIGRIDVMGSGPRTAAGIRIGSTLSKLRAAYPALTGPFIGPVSHVWWIQDAHGTIAFETQDDANGLRPAGTVESVILIRVLAPGSSAEFAAANSGDVAGACF